MAKEVAAQAADINASKLKALQATIDKIEKDFGKGTIMKLGEQPQWDVQVIPSGSVALDHALGIGGYPRGRIVEIYGPESSGKTTLAIHAIAQAQKTGGIAAMIDAEHAFDRTYAKALGVNLETLLISQPDNGEQALEIADNLIRSGAIDIVVIDSVAALTPKAEIEGEMGDNKVGLQARLMSQALRKLTANIAKTNTCCIFINQLREKIGVMFGNPETTTGGNALKFYASVRIDVRRTTQLKDGDGLTAELIEGTAYRIEAAQSQADGPYTVNIGKQTLAEDVNGRNIIPGEISYQDQRQSFMFRAGSSGEYRFTVANMEEGCRVELSVYSALGDRLVSSQDMSSGDELTCELTEGRGYQIRLKQLSGTGPFTITMAAQRRDRNED